MVNHAVEAEELQAYLDRELSPARQAEVEQHLSECRACAALLEELQQVSATLQQWQVEPAPGSLHPPAVECEQAKRRWWQWPRLLVLALAATAAAVLLAGVLSLDVVQRAQIEPLEPGKMETGIQPGKVEMPMAAAPAPPAAAAAAQRRDQAAPPAAPAMSKQMLASAPRLIAYEASLLLEVKDIEAAKVKLVKVVEGSGGYIGEASSGESPGQARFADYTLRVPAENLSAAMDALRALGRVKQESLTSEEVTAQVVDLEARLRNARATEERLIAVLKEKTGKVRDILEVEREIASTRESVERMEARREYLLRRVAFSTLSVTLVEEFKAQLQPAPAGTATRLRNVFVEGYENFAGTLLGLIFFFARHGMNLLFWGGLVWLSARLAWRAFQRRYRWA